MLWWVIAAGILFVIVLIGLIIATEDGLDWVSGVGLFVFVAFVVGFCACVMNVIFMNVGYRTATKQEVVGLLQSVRDGQAIHGSFSGGFFLAVGSVNSTPEYTYYLRDADGSYSLHALDADGVKVWQDSTTPRLTCELRYLAHDHSSLLSIFPPQWEDDNRDAAGCTSYEFHVPPGSIVHDYVLGK
jgi:hypothetical protein